MVDRIVALLMEQFSLPSKLWPNVYRMAKNLQDAGLTDNEVHEELEYLLKAAEKIASHNIFDLVLSLVL